MSTAEKFQPALLEEVIGDRFGTYSKYIIQDRAIPDVRDGLKPVQRRILYAMYVAGNTSDKPYRKSAKTVGDVMGNYHPHGDSSIYEGMVRLAQPWKMNHPLVDGHGNWGSIDDDPAAAMRYTEARLSPIAAELLRDIEKNTVPFKDNFDNTVQEPVVLPARFPNLLVNGVSGISSGFATEIPTHNLREVIDACIAVMEKSEINVEELMKIVKGPDFPTGGIVMGKDGIKKAYTTGKGRIVVRAKTDIETLRGGKKQIVITEIPYQVVKSRLVTAMEMIRIEKKVEGIAEVRDESGREGLRIVIELKKDADADGILAYMFKKTDLQINYNFNMVAIVNKTPKQLGLKQMLEAYIAHQKEVVTNRTRYDLAKAEDRAHVLEGLVKALNILDDVLETIKSSKNRQDAHHNLISRFDFTERQAEAILTLQLYRLTNLEIHSLQKELNEMQKQVARLTAILQSEKKLTNLIKKELLQIKEAYGVDRRTQVEEDVEEVKVNIGVLVTPEDVLVTLSQEGYIKRSSLLSFNRSGRDKESTGLKEGDSLRCLMEVNTLDHLLLFTNKGQYFLLPVYQIPEYKWKDNGTAVVNLIPITKDDHIVKVIPVKQFSSKQSLYFITRKGQVKRTLLHHYETKRSIGITACKLNKDDEVIDVIQSDGYDELLLVTKKGMSIRIQQEWINPMGRATAGVKGIQLKDDDEVISALHVKGNEGEVFVLSDRGYAKRSLLTDYTVQNRGGIGLKTFEFNKGKGARSNGSALVKAFYVKEDNDLLVHLSNGNKKLISTGKAPLELRNSKGSVFVKVPKNETVTNIVPLL